MISEKIYSFHRKIYDVIFFLGCRKIDEVFENESIYSFNFSY
jgi:hypothetical protein